MFFQSLMYLLLFIGFLLAIWHFVIKTILEDTGIETEEKKEVVTYHVINLKKKLKEYEEKKISLEAAQKNAELSKEISDIDSKIKELNEQIKNPNSTKGSNNG